MTSQHTFERPHRPLGIRLFNVVGGFLRTVGLPIGSLSEQSLLEAARRRTGLADFGEDGFRQGLQVLLKAYQEEADLSPSGRSLIRLNLLSLLCNRLRIQNELKQHPEILETPVRRPIIIAALPRTGTTLLYNLLAQDPAARALLMWEAVSPAQRPKDKGKDPDPRIRRVVLGSKLLKKLAPDLPSIHPINPRGPEECSRLMLNTFMTVYALLEGRLPSYRDWLLGLPPESLEAAYRHYYGQLQLLQWQRPPRGHWVLKSPAHLLSLGSLLKVFPDACVVQLHRDPRKVIASTCSLFATYRGIFSDNVRPKELGPEIAELFVEGFRRSHQAREAAPGRVLDVHYPDLVKDPIAAVRKVYEHFGYPFTEELESRSKSWVHENPKDKHGKHRYDLEQFGLDRATIDRLFEPYCRQYQIEPEDRPACRSHK